MVSERLLQNRTKHAIIALQICCMVASGFFLAKSLYFPSMLLLIGGFIGLGLQRKINNSINLLISSFFDALNNNDTAVHYNIGIRSKSLVGLSQRLNQLNNHFQEIKLQSEIKEKYYHALIRHSATGLLVLNDDRIELINKMACRYAGISAESTNTNLLKIKNPQFYDAICRLRPGGDVTYKQISGNEFHLLLFRATNLYKNQQSVKLISIQDIRQELESKEVDSYKKLISVMTHEIMNLMSPLTSVSKALYGLYYKNREPVGVHEIDENLLKTTISSMQVINEQSRGILSFIENFRKISRIPAPVLQPFDAEEWSEQLRIVFTQQLLEKSIELTVNQDKQLKQITADKNLINQVLINIINNATDALSDIVQDRKISVDIGPGTQNTCRIKIRNNGPQISADVQEKIFVPFFTTKKDGSGIGLSISQEIVKLHKGSLMVFSTAESTSFIIEI
jgi:two-component system, NtrC family, nitrogen regulation sensor histidine kinase NtrY